MRIFYCSALILLFILSVSAYNSRGQSSSAAGKIYRLSEFNESFYSANKHQVSYHHAFKYDAKGKPVSHLLEYRNNGKLISQGTMKYQYDEKTGRLIAQSNDTLRYSYYYGANNQLSRITLYINMNKVWTLCEETFLEHTERSGTKHLLLTMAKLRTNGPRKNAFDLCSKIDYKLDSANSIRQSRVMVFDFAVLKSPREYDYHYDSKPNPSQQIFIERWYEIDIENKGATNLLAKSINGKALYSRAYTYNSAGYPVKCIINGKRNQEFKYQEITVPIEKPVQALAVTETNLVMIYPNPASTEVTVKANGLGTGDAYLRLYDLNGRVQRAIKYSVNNTFEALVPLNGLPQGVYILEIIAPNSKTRKKLLVE